MATGPHKLEFEVVEGWERLPEGWSFTEVAGVAVDSRERVFVFCRGDHPVIAFDKDGQFLDAWGEGVFARPHGIYIDRQDRVHCVDCDDHTIRTFTGEGELLDTMGQAGIASDTGFRLEQSPVKYAGAPFNMVTNVVVCQDGSKYVTDGYGNARVHKFAPDGAFLAAFGDSGTGPGQFRHPIAVGVAEDGAVFVADFQNNRVEKWQPR